MFFLSSSGPGASSIFWLTPLFCRCLALRRIFFLILAFGFFVCFCLRFFGGFWPPRPRRILGPSLHFAGVWLCRGFFFEFVFFAFCRFFFVTFCWCCFALEDQNNPGDKHQEILSLHHRQIRGSIVVSISACHAEDPGSIPGRGVSYGFPDCSDQTNLCVYHLTFISHRIQERQKRHLWDSNPRGETPSA